ncbi:ABC transporter ATP-binding protein [Litorisediminicola beolgyonensis]|uniref:ABC transporter ATP-binding protein n=1 Tax=Litorisediminicola beolgyonensis TaxID=1173614 RepID=A0ABW3ZM63_9RHOB
MFRFFETAVDPYTPHAASDRPPSGLWPWLIEHSRPYKRLLWIAGILSVLVAGVEIALIWAMGWVVDILAAGPEAVWRDHGTTLLLLGAALLVVRPLLQALDVLVLNNAILPGFVSHVRWRSHRHVLRQSVGWFEDDFAGRIANRVMQTPSAAGEAVFQIFDALAFALAYVAGAAVLLGQSEPFLALPLLAWFGLYLGLMSWTIRRIGPASKRASDARSALTGRIVDSYTNIHAVKMFAHHDREEAYGTEAIERTRESFAAEMRLYTLMDVMLTGLNGLLIVSVTGMALWFWGLGTATVGAVAAAVALCLRLNAMTGWIMWALTTFFQQLGIISEGLESIADPIALTDAPGAAPLTLTEGRIRIEALSHHYGRGAGGLDRISLEIAPGEKVGLVGRSGAGKSTLVKLMLRFYDAEAGRIVIDGQDIAGVTQASLRRQIGVVQQDSSLLHRSIRENILYGRPGASEAEMIAAAKQAQAHDFISGLVDAGGRRGYDAQVGERGVKLSGGQRQRIALARVILKDAPILVLDEATSALDSEVEAAIQDTLYRMMEGKTVIAIAHRLSTIARMDRIVVIEDGHVAEDGPHEKLLAEKGLYAGFWSRQSGGFLDADRDDATGRSDISQETA